MFDMPYFMNEEDWYEYDWEKEKYILTDKAPKEAKKSYEKFYKELEKEK